MPSGNCNCMMILVTTALRTSEVPALRIADVNLCRGLLTAFPGDAIVTVTRSGKVQLRVTFSIRL